MATTTVTVTDTAIEPMAALEMRPIKPKSDRHNAALNPGDDPEGPDDATQATRLDRATYIKLMSAGFAFVVTGVNDGSLGALIPYMIREYNISTAIVSAIYGATFGGWVLAAFINTHLSQYLDLGAMLSLGALVQALAFALRCWKPPFGLFATSFMISSIGQAFQDTHCNTFAASVKGGHRWLAFIHAMYATGCLIAPFVATAVASAGEESRWYLYYTFACGLGVLNLALCMYAFRDTLGYKDKSRKNRMNTSSSPDDVQIQLDTTSDGQQHPPTEEETSRSKSANQLLLDIMKTGNVWLLCMFFFFYLGSVLTASGWVVEYLVDVRNGSLSQMGYVPAGFNGGTLLGRLLLAEPTHRFGMRKMITIYCTLSIALQLVFWLGLMCIGIGIDDFVTSVPNIIAASIAISFVGFFMGPLFATGMTLGVKLFPPHLYSTALALVFVCAMMGGSVFPVLTGVVAASAGVQVLQPILIALLVLTLISWLIVSRPKALSSNAPHQE